MNNGATMRVGYEAQECSTAIPTPDDWSGFESYRTFVNAVAGASATADWTMRDVAALNALAAQFGV